MTDFGVYQALAKLHHAYFLGLQLMVSSNAGSQVVGDWMFRLFRKQHEEKFLSSFDKLGLSGLPHAVACARYHVLSNGVGGVPVEYMYESDRKAWVRFRYPRWMFAGPTVCGVPESASRGFLEGWYAHNGVSLDNPRLGFVCVSEDMTGEFGLCGYFFEYDHELAPSERLRFVRDERPPPYRSDEQPQPPAQDWSEERLAKANRNYAVEYVRNGISQLMHVLPEEEVLRYTSKAARLIGLQYAQELADDLDVQIDSPEELAWFIRTLLQGMGDEVSAFEVEQGVSRFEHTDLRICRGFSSPEQDVLLSAWTELFRGFGMAQRGLVQVDADRHDDGLSWRICSAD